MVNEKERIFQMKPSTDTILTLLTVATLCLLLLFCILPIHGEGEIYDKVLRLHVIANSDSEADQSLKLKVRDAVLEQTTPLISGVASRDEAAVIIANHSSEIEKAAAAELARHGCFESVALEICEEYYPTKDYERFCFPAGNYLSVKVKIGEAEGKNWWCVLFPKLCTSIAVKPAEEFVAVGFTPDQYKVITESEKATYKVRFRLLEFFEELKGE